MGDIYARFTQENWEKLRFAIEQPSCVWPDNLKQAVVEDLNAHDWSEREVVREEYRGIRYKLRRHPFLTWNGYISVPDALKEAAEGVYVHGDWTFQEPDGANSVWKGFDTLRAGDLHVCWMVTGGSIVFFDNFMFPPEVFWTFEAVDAECKRIIDEMLQPK
jgi:hypothetical protein